jgi:hypothetical protein
VVHEEELLDQLCMRILSVVILLTGCGGSDHPGARPADPVLVHWHVAQAMWGEENLTVRNDGIASYSYVAAGESSPSRQDQMQMSPSDIAALRDALVRNHACDLHPTIEQGNNDEGRPVLDLGFAEQRCRIEMWDRDWRGVGAPVLHLIEALRDNIAPIAPVPVPS